MASNSSAEESLKDFILRFPRVLLLVEEEVEAKKEEQEQTGPTRSTTTIFTPTPPNYDVRIPAETGDDEATALEEPVQVPTVVAEAEAVAEAAETVRNDNEARVRPVLGPVPRRVVGVEVPAPEDFAQTRSESVIQEEEVKPVPRKGGKGRKARERAREAKKGGKAGSAGVKWKIPRGVTRKPAELASSGLVEAQEVESGSIAIEAQRKIVQAEDDDSFRAKVPLLGRQPPPSEPQLHPLSSLGKPKPKSKAKKGEPADAARAVRTQTAHAEEHQSRAARTEASRAQAEELSSGVARTEATRAQAPSAGPPLWMIRRQVHEALNNRNDGELRHVLQRRYYSVPTRRRLAWHLVMERTIEFLHVAQNRLDARLAMIFLANADWNLEVAFQRYLEERYSDSDSDSSEDEQPAASKGPEAEVPTVGLEPSPDDLLSFEEPQPKELFTFKAICPCNLDGHNCMRPLRCRFLRNAICTVWDCKCHGKIHMPENCQSLRNGQHCMHGGWPRCRYGHDIPPDTERSEQAAIHAAHHRGDV